MNRRICTILLAAAASFLILSPAAAVAQGNSGNHGHSDDKDHGNGNGHGNGHGHSDDDDRDHGHGGGPKGRGESQRYFRDRDRDYLVRYYDGPRDLPPGLRKKYYRNQALPPGWEKRFRPMPQQVIVQLPPVPYGYQRGYYDGYAVVVDPRTRIVVDVVDILNAVQGR